MKRCPHNWDKSEILSVTPALPGFGFALLYCPDPELTISTIAAWALVRRDDGVECECPRKVVVPLLARLDTLAPEFPFSDDELESQSRIIEPGERPVVRLGKNDRLWLATEPGTWAPGSTPLNDADLDRRGGP